MKRNLNISEEEKVSLGLEDFSERDLEGTCLEEGKSEICDLPGLGWSWVLLELTGGRTLD